MFLKRVNLSEKLKEFRSISNWRLRVTSAKFIYSALAIIVFVFLNSNWGRTAVKTAFLLPEIFPGVPLRPLQWISRPPIVEEMEISFGKEKIKADVYRPNDSKKHPMAVLIQSGMDPRSQIISGYANGFSRTGMVIVVPNIPGLTAKDVTIKVSHVEDLINIFEVTRQKDYVDLKKTGFIGLCYGGTLALVAAANSSIADKVDFMIVAGPYFDNRDTSAQIYNNILIMNGKVLPWQPASSMTRTMNKFLISTLPDEKEKIILTKYESGELAINELGNFSTDGQRILKFLEFTKKSYSDSFSFEARKEEFLRLYNSLPVYTLDVLATLSPSKKIKEVKAKVYILADSYDVWAPHTEGLNLAASLPKNQRVYITLGLFENNELLRKLPRLKFVQELARLEIFIFRVLVEIF